MPNFDLVLATDLDGTFLEGDTEIKTLFYNELLALRERVMLIYTTGRPVEIVAGFCKNKYLPHPHFIIGDHGTHIANGADFQIVEALQNPIINKWNNANHYLRTLLQNEPGIELQPLDPPYRVAYYYDPQTLQQQTINKIIDAGFDVILSCDMYLDIVPKSVNKGSSLINLLDHAQVAHEVVITAGDSLNDLSLFQTGLKSIAVANSEPKLVEEIKLLPNVYHSPYPGVWGIIDGLNFHEKIKLFNFSSAA